MELIFTYLQGPVQSNRRNFAQKASPETAILHCHRTLVGIFAQKMTHEGWPIHMSGFHL